MAPSDGRGENSKTGSKALRELREQLDALIGLVETSDRSQLSYLNDRWKPQVLTAKHRAEFNRKWYYSWRVPVVTGALAVPALASPTVDATSVRWVAFGVSLLVAIATALESAFRFGNRWRLYRRMFEELHSEGWAYAQRVGRHAPPRVATFSTFAGRTEAAIRRYGEEYISDVLVLGASNEPTTGAADMDQRLTISRHLPRTWDVTVE